MASDHRNKGIPLLSLLSQCEGTAYPLVVPSPRPGVGIRAPAIFRIVPLFAYRPGWPGG